MSVLSTDGGSGSRTRFGIAPSTTARSAGTTTTRRRPARSSVMSDPVVPEGLLDGVPEHEVDDEGLEYERILSQGIDSEEALRLTNDPKFMQWLTERTAATNIGTKVLSTSRLRTLAA